MHEILFFERLHDFITLKINLLFSDKCTQNELSKIIITSNTSNYYYYLYIFPNLVKLYFQTNGARRQQQQPPSSQQQPQSQQGGMMQQQQQQQIIKGEDETNDAKIIEFAKTISEKDKKIKAAAESKTKVSNQ